jgi:hypothetical protein
MRELPAWLEEVQAMLPHDLITFDIADDKQLRRMLHHIYIESGCDDKHYHTFQHTDTKTLRRMLWVVRTQ